MQSHLNGSQLLKTAMRTWTITCFVIVEMYMLIFRIKLLFYNSLFLYTFILMTN